MISPKPRIAIIGSGISGLATAYALQGSASISLFEANDYFGGHTHTVDITLPTDQGLITHGVDTGFLVFNDRTYPQLIRLFDELGIESSEADMSFSVQVPRAGKPALEWSGANLNGLFAQRSNVFKPRFWGMLADILRFNRLCTTIAEKNEEGPLRTPISEFLDTHRFSQEFKEGYFLPMMGSIWSCPTNQMLEFPVSTMIRFCYNHGLIQILNRPQWRSVVGGARRYVEAIVASIPDKRLSSPVKAVYRDSNHVRILSDKGFEDFDEVVIATHSDQALSLLATPTVAERSVLGAISFQDNLAVLHTDGSVLPEAQAAWAAWNYERADSEAQEATRVCLHYYLNRLQQLPFNDPVIVSLNPVRPIDPKTILGEFHYAHPVFDLSSLDAQSRLRALQGQQHTWFAGAWTGYGFHEDGLSSGLKVAEAIKAKYALSPIAVAA